jgi:hypothetical protein
VSKRVLSLSVFPAIRFTASLFTASLFAASRFKDTPFDEILFKETPLELILFAASLASAGNANMAVIAKVAVDATRSFDGRVIMVVLSFHPNEDVRLQLHLAEPQA